jgi:hypothetical protein
MPALPRSKMRVKHLECETVGKLSRRMIVWPALRQAAGH